MNTTDTTIKEMYDAFAMCKTNKSKVKFLLDHKESGLYKSYDINWDNLIKVWSSKNPSSFFKQTVIVDEDENKEGTKDTLDNNKETI